MMEYIIIFICIFLILIALSPIFIFYWINKRIIRNYPTKEKLEEVKKQVNNTSDEGSYTLFGIIVGFIIFVIIWIYAITSWGLLLGLTLGWIPAIIGAVIAGILWPITILLIIGLLILVFK